MKKGAIVVWDQLGRAGRALEPKKQHWNPEIKAGVSANGCGMLMLAPKGAELNPVELLNAFLQHQVKRMWNQRLNSSKHKG